MSILSISPNIKTIFVKEEECNMAIEKAVKEAKETNRNTNIIPQILGFNPVSVCVNSPACPFFTIIIREIAR
jgi:hypothetical protein